MSYLLVRIDQNEPEVTDVFEINDGQVSADFFDDCGELVRLEVDVLDPDASHRPHGRELRQPLLSVHHLHRRKLLPGKNREV